MTRLSVVLLRALVHGQLSWWQHCVALGFRPAHAERQVRQLHGLAALLLRGAE